jgi:hypothetical protein
MASDEWRQAADRAREEARTAITQTLDRGFADLEAVWAAHLRQAEAAPQRLLALLGQTFRRLRAFENEAQWCETILDAAAKFSSRAAVFSVNVDRLVWKAGRGLPAVAEVALPDAPALQAVITANEMTVALKTAGELSPALAAAFGEDAGARFAAFPIATRQRVAGLLYAEEGDLAALELIATFAGTALESHWATGEARRPSNVVSLTPAPAAPPVSERQLKAQRFARVKVAEMRLYQAEAVRSGRAARNLYGALREAIDGARAEYRAQFMNSPGSADELHQELLRVLAKGDAELMGPGYPGPLA